jgi:hypothetical protein
LAIADGEGAFAGSGASGDWLLMGEKSLRGFFACPLAAFARASRRCRFAWLGGEKCKKIDCHGFQKKPLGTPCGPHVWALQKPAKSPDGGGQIALPAALLMPMAVFGVLFAC